MRSSRSGMGRHCSRRHRNRSARPGWTAPATTTSATWPGISTCGRCGNSREIWKSNSRARFAHCTKENKTMASIHKEFLIESSPEQVWAAVRDVGMIHKRLVPGFVTDCRMDGTARIVTFGNGMVVREEIVDLDDSTRRLVWS